MTTSPDCTTIEKDIVYNRPNRDYDCFLIVDGARNFIGSAATYHDGENLCNDEYYNLLEATYAPPDTHDAPVEDESREETPHVDTPDTDLSSESDDTIFDIRKTVEVFDGHEPATHYSSHRVCITFDDCGVVLFSIGDSTDHGVIKIWFLEKGENPQPTFRALDRLLQNPDIRARLELDDPIEKEVA